MKKVFYGRNRNGKTEIDNKHQLNQFLLDFEDEAFQITVENRFKKRSLEQNGFYFGNVISSQIECFKEYWGEVYTAKQIHDWNKATFWADIAIVNNEPISMPATSTKYSTIEWEERVDQIRAFFLDKFDWAIEYPNSQAEMPLKF